MKILTNDEIKQALTTCEAGTCFSDNCPLKDAEDCVKILIMNALVSGDHEFILRGIDIYEDYYGQRAFLNEDYYGQIAFLNDVKTLLTEDNNG